MAIMSTNRSIRPITKPATRPALDAKFESCLTSLEGDGELGACVGCDMMTVWNPPIVEYTVTPGKAVGVVVEEAEGAGVVSGVSGKVIEVFSSSEVEVGLGDGV